MDRTKKKKQHYFDSASVAKDALPFSFMYLCKVAISDVIAIKKTVIKVNCTEKQPFD